MSEKAKLILGIVLGIICAVAIFSLVVIIGCSVNGLTFGEQIVQWFSPATEVIENAPNV